jgi:hypothetical protein
MICLTLMYQDVAVFAGGLVQIDSVVHGNVVVGAAVPGIVSAFTSTGITAPVFNEKA